jgi:predicted amidohydrolase YtcJ
MRRRIFLHTIAEICAFVAVLGSRGEAQTRTDDGERLMADTVFYNGTIHTMEPGMPLAGAIAVREGKILAVGASDELVARLGPGARTLDLKGRTVLPGLVDAHCHFLGYAEERVWIDLMGTASLDEIVSAVAERVSSQKPGTWILGRGWDQNDWPDTRYPEKAVLDAIAPNNPVYLVRVCGHAAFVSSRALALAGITRETEDPSGGRIARTGSGDPTGVLFDEATEMVGRCVPEPGAQEKKRLLIEAARECLSVGLVGVHEMGISLGTESLYEDLLSTGALPLRIVAYYSGDDPQFETMTERGPRRGLGNDHLSIVGCKFYADGSLGARSAALLADYTDDPGNRGILVTPLETLVARIRRCSVRGFQAATHAIGDRAVRQMLDIYGRVLAERPFPDARHRIEHSQVVAPADIPRFAAIGVIPSMQFTHCTSDMPWAERRLGPERVKGAYAWRSLIEAGSRIPGGSDFPVESINPFLGIYAAVTRRDLAGNPAGGWFPAQCLTVREALAAFTIDAAYAAHEETVAGSLAPGKRADFIVCSDDVFAVPPDAIPRVRALATVVGGTIVYRADQF